MAEIIKPKCGEILDPPLLSTNPAFPNTMSCEAVFRAIVDALERGLPNLLYVPLPVGRQLVTGTDLLRNDGKRIVVVKNKPGKKKYRTCTLIFALKLDPKSSEILFLKDDPDAESGYEILTLPSRETVDFSTQKLPLPAGTEIFEYKKD